MVVVNDERTSIERLLHSRHFESPCRAQRGRLFSSPFLRRGGRDSEGPSIAGPGSHRMGEKQGLSPAGPSQFFSTV